MSEITGTDVVTGGAGFIGSELVRRLVADGRRVIVLDNLKAGQPENLQGLPDDRIEIVVGDVQDQSLAATWLGHADVVYHLACVNRRHSLLHPEVGHAVNATGTLALLEAARATPPKRWVHVSSSEVYGSARRTPMDETHPTEPTTSYGASKLAGEAYARAYSSSYGLPVVILRPFNAFGSRARHDGDRGEVIPKFVLRALAGEPLTIFGDGGQTSDFTHVSDIVDGIHAAGSATDAIGRTFNLGSGREIAIADLARLVVSLVGTSDARITHVPARSGDRRRLCADSSAAKQVLGFDPTHDLADGIVEIADSFRAHPRGLEALLAEERA
jgi:UDP-glucose 4-epimerase